MVPAVVTPVSVVVVVVGSEGPVVVLVGSVDELVSAPVLVLVSPVLVPPVVPLSTVQPEPPARRTSAANQVR